MPDLVANKAVDYVKSGMVLSLNTGSIVAFIVDKLGKLLKSGQLIDIIGVPTSKHTQEHALSLSTPSPASTTTPSPTSPLTAPKRSTLS
ncbi:putative ribose-5-phosphate isomerase 3, chloroplastic [Turnera subulata]|uniref:Ribose-5-phosphate isomerase 3, chloroplastic n=1 Tax=Turnera subulata TaxID=218843 RepID=A0A9Q0JNM2_9ROSI|nr:putative ribose-5-phosphate isomerase 3, chloroplastic [Turnera subulata]